jgi:hypothetical protein
MGDGNAVKLGVCDVSFDSTDLGYTKGGVTLTVETQVHEILVDQEGPAPVGAVIMGRRCTVNVPLAETNYSRLQGLMPGSSYTGGTNLWDIQSGTGLDLLDYAATLTLHPHNIDSDDNRWDINIWKASPVANLQLTMTADGEWVYPIQFTGFVPESGHDHESVILTFGGTS